MFLVYSKVIQLYILYVSKYNIFFFILFFFFCLLRAIPAAYGCSQVRGQIRAVASGLRHSHSNARSEPCL